MLSCTLEPDGKLDAEGLNVSCPYRSVAGPDCLACHQARAREHLSQFLDRIDCEKGISASLWGDA